MRIRRPGRIHEKLWFLGDADACIYLLEGKNGSILINGGMSFVVPGLLRQLRDFRIDESRIEKILVLHSHFDHVGIVPFFKRRHPQIVLCGSACTLQILQKPKAIQAINAANHYVIEHRGLTRPCSGYELDAWVGISGEPLGEGDRIDLGDVEVRIIETPGHSPCSISAYVPEIKALFPSDGGGVPLGEKIITYGVSDYAEFERSLQKMRDLEVEYLCSDHYGYVTGEEAKTFISDSIEAAKMRRSLMLAAYLRTGSVEKAARELAEQFQDENAASLIPAEVFLESFRQMVMDVVGLKRSRIE